MRKQHTPSGFTLLEVSAVLAVIGLLIAGVVGATQIIKNAKAYRIIEDVQQFTELANQFEKQYGSMPGDISNISDYFAGETNGNDDGLINDTNDEDLAFWRHLMLAGLYTAGTFDGASRFDLGGGVPEAPFTTAGYKVRKDETFGLYFEIAGYSATSDSLAVLEPATARSIDDRVDDGDPDTGRVRGTGTNCVSGGEYDMSVTDRACILQVLTKIRATTETPAAAVTCSGGGVEGEVRIDDTQTCPDGYEGKVLRICQLDGSWGNKFNCEITRCFGNALYGETRTVSCPDSYSGTISQECGPGGVWQTTSNTCSVPAGGTCTAARTLPCPFGSTGNITQACSGGTYAAAVDNCTDIQCSGSADVGNISTSVLSCSSPYASGAYTSVCTMDSTVGAEWKPIANTCQAHQTCSTAASPRTIACPDGEEGTHTQTCPSDGANWVTSVNTCASVDCGGETIGAVRVVEGVDCPSGSGVVIEICDDDGTWVRDESNCLP